MRIVLAYDASTGAQQAAALVGSIAWPEGSTLRVINAIDPMPMLVSTAWAGGMASPVPDLDAEVAAFAESEMTDVARSLGEGSHDVQTAVLRGRPASVIVDDARAFAADVVVIGSRGHGTITALVLGSVSGEVVDHAPCPVLVARQPGLRRVLFATDGSVSSSTAEAVTAGWSIFEGLEVRVLSVADAVPPWRRGIGENMSQRIVDTYARDLEREMGNHQRIAEEGAARLRLAGRKADAAARAGDPAAEIIAAATEWDADLVVLGSRGRTGLTRLLLGSVARNVVHGSVASVLIVRNAVEA